MTPRSASNCPCCSATLGEPFYEAADVPVETSVVLDSADAAVGFPTGSIALCVCDACGFVTNASFRNEIGVPQNPYEDQQGYSPTFTEFASRMAARLVETYGVRGGTVVEIGCGKGDFLALVCETGDNRGIGIDPLARAARLPVSARGRVELVSEHYADHHGAYRPDLVVCRHTLEHIADVSGFLDTVRRSLGDDSHAILSIEVPDVVRILDEGAFWDVYYEHCSYFSPGSLARALAGHGFDVIDLFREYGNQYAVADARPARGNRGGIDPSTDTPGDLARRARRFGDAARHAVARWRETIRGAARPPAIWGSGSKCVAFVSTLGVADAIGPVVDINPFRQGKYVPGIPTPVRAPEGLAEASPDTVIAMNPVYLDEIRADVRRMGLDAEVIAV